MKETIYKKGNDGDIRYLTISTTARGEFHQTSGKLGTPNPIIHSRVCHPKNIGKSNETTSAEQAEKEAKSKLEDKLSQGYYKTAIEAKESTLQLPMLAKDYKKESQKIDWEKDDVFVQPKLDGMRCIKNKSKLISRKNKLISNMMHIEAEDGLEYILDGELYLHGEDFQTNMKYIKKYRAGKSKKIKYHVYDLMVPGLSFKDRYTILEDKFKNNLNIKVVPTYRINSEEELKIMHTKFLSEGYEGTIVRWGDAEYKVNGRSSNLLKYKDFIDIACKIIAIGPAKKRPTWARPVVEWNGKQFACSTKMSHEAREEMLINAVDYIGKTAEVRYFEEYDTGVPRFPVLVGIRLDK